MKTIALALLVALPAFADDAPRCLEPSDRIALAKTVVDLQTVNAKLEKDLTAAPSPVLVVVLVVAGVLVGGAVGVAVDRAVRK